MRRKPEGERRKVYTLTLLPRNVDTLQKAADKWGMSLSKFVERGGLWYTKELEVDPSKIKAPADETS